MVQWHPIVRTGIMWPGTRLTCSVRSQGSAGPTLCATGLEHPGAPTSERQNRADDEVTRHRSPPLRLGRRATIGRCEVLDRHARWVEQLAPAPLDECCRGEEIHSKVRPSPSSRVEQAAGNRRDVHAAGRTGLRCPHRRIDRPVPRPPQLRSVDGRAREGLPHGTHRSGRQPGATRPRSTAVTSSGRAQQRVQSVERRSSASLRATASTASPESYRRATGPSRTLSDAMGSRGRRPTPIRSNGCRDPRLSG